jgi:OPA family glycerol-3-phosphate transporter-like MFS transporter
MGEAVDNRRRRRQAIVTLATLFVGYSGYYLCRSNLAVTAKLLEKDTAGGLSEENVSWLMSMGVVLYAEGKFFNGVLADRLGGRTLFLFGMAASAVCTALFGVGWGVAVLAVCWGLNRFVQSMGWPALVKVAAGWWSGPRAATAMGVLCMSYLLGDAAARVVLGGLIEVGLGWRGVFLASSAILAALTAVAFFTLREAPEQPRSPDPDCKERSNPESRVAFGALLMFFATQPVFWLVCAINLGLTLIRETFNSWTPTFLQESVGFNDEQAAYGSAVVPLAGAVAALAGGWLSDRCHQRHARIMLPAMVLLGLALATLGIVPLAGRPLTALILLGGAAAFLMVPYTFCSGVMSIDLGGQRASATASGLVDTAGYVGAVFSGRGIKEVAKQFGWETAFIVLAGTAALTTLAVIAYAWAAKRQRALLVSEEGAGDVSVGG